MGMYFVVSLLHNKCLNVYSKVTQILTGNAATLDCDPAFSAAPAPFGLCVPSLRVIGGLFITSSVQKARKMLLLLLW